MSTVERSRSFRSFAAARAFARTLGLTTRKQWQQFARGERQDLGPFPSDLPMAPENAYRDDGWRGFPDFLGGGSARGGWRPFPAARRFARSLRLESVNAWRRWLRGELPDRPARPMDLPRWPHRCYADAGWTDWYDFLGTARPAAPRRRRGLGTS